MPSGMARAIWTGALSFGLVNVPVRLYPATKEHEVRFHQFQKGTSSRIRNKRVNEKTGREVDFENIVKGADVGGGNYVMLTQSELAAVEPGRSRTIEISDFVDAAEIDPIHYQKSYFVGPADETAHKAYALLVRAMDSAGRIAVATFVMRTKEYLAAIRPREDVLVLETMFFADEICEPAETLDLPSGVRLAKKDVDLARRLIDSMTVPWKPERYRDAYTERVEDLVEAKRKDADFVPEPQAEPAGEVVDLMQALQASLEAARSSKPKSKAKSTRSKAS